MAKKKVNASFLANAKKSIFNASDWTPVGEPYDLEDVWEDVTGIPYKDISSDKAEITATEFSDGSVGLRIAVPVKDGSVIELKLSGKSDLEEGDYVDISTITAQELKKAGQDNIVRYDGEPVKDEA